MCGIFAIFDESKEGLDYEKCDENAMLLQRRGPDVTIKKKLRIGKYEAFLVFHRLMINDQTDAGNQPMYIDNNVILMCNGEIYNHKYLEQKYDITPKSKSDCEVIGHLYNKIGMEEMHKQLDSVHAMVLIDMNTNTVHVGRDNIGVRPLFYGYNDVTFGFASEMGALMNLGFDEIVQVPGGHIWNSNDKQFVRYYDISFGNIVYKNLSQTYITKKINRLLNRAVKSQIMSDRPIGSLLSGVDSSLITALLVKHNPTTNPIVTFTIGFKDGEDLAFGRRTAKYLGTIHNEIIVSEEEMLAILPETVKTIGSFDSTSIRASAFMLMLAKYIKEKTDVKVIYSGETMDELSGSYLYFYNAPSPEEFKKETHKLLEELPTYDILRADRTLSSCGLEVRVPYLNNEFVDFYMKLDPAVKWTKPYNMEKFLLRKSFDDEEKLLPNETLFRIKSAMSDASSSKKRMWFTVIQEHTDVMYTDEEFERLASTYEHCPPLTKEALYYRQLYDKFYPGMDKMIPHYWLPNQEWCGKVTNPSAWILDLDVNKKN